MDAVAGDTLRITVLRTIEEVVENVIMCLAYGTSPRIKVLNNCCWDNVAFDRDIGFRMISTAKSKTICMHSRTSIAKLGRMLKILRLVYSNVQNSVQCTKRDIFYQDPKLFGRQASLNRIINDITLLLKIPRTSLNVHSSSKGLVAGDLEYLESSGNHINCSQFPFGIPIPFFVEKLTDLKSSAKFVLIVEKDASFQRIIEDNFIGKYGPCIILTGKGFPDQNSRALLKMLWERLHLPAFCLVDADPHGIEIMTIYKYGSRALCHETHRLAVPSVQWLGVLPSDVERFHIPTQVMLPMTAIDLKKANELLKRDSVIVHPDWVKEIHLMVETKMKAEIQCLDSLKSTFLVDFYLPNKLKLFLSHKLKCIDKE